MTRLLKVVVLLRVLLWAVTARPAAPWFATAVVVVKTAMSAQMKSVVVVNEGSFLNRLFMLSDLIF